MTDPYLHNREFFGSVSGNYRALAADTGLIALVPAIPLHTFFVQKLHIEVTTIAGAELWTFQDGAGIPIVPSVSAAAIAHFDFDFGPDGVPCTEGTNFNVNITGAVGAIGWITWEGFKKLTAGAAPSVGGGAAAAPAPLVVTSLKSIGPVGIGPGALPDANHPLSIVDTQNGQMQSQLWNQSPGAGAYAEFSVRVNDASLYFGIEGSTSGDVYGKNRGYLIVNSPVAANMGMDFAVSQSGSYRFHSAAGAAYNAAAVICLMTPGGLSAPSVRGNAVLFANLPAAPVEGMVAWVTDSTVNTWGTVIAGGGANHVLACFNGTNWTVAGK